MTLLRICKLCPLRHDFAAAATATAVGGQAVSVLECILCHSTSCVIGLPGGVAISHTRRIGAPSSALMMLWPHILVLLLFPMISATTGCRGRYLHYSVHMGRTDATRLSPRDATCITGTRLPTRVLTDPMQRNPHDLVIAVSGTRPSPFTWLLTVDLRRLYCGDRGHLGSPQTTTYAGGHCTSTSLLLV